MLVAKFWLPRTTLVPADGATVQVRAVGLMAAMKLVAAVGYAFKKVFVGTIEKRTIRSGKRYLLESDGIRRIKLSPGTLLRRWL